MTRPPTPDLQIGMNGAEYWLERLAMPVGLTAGAVVLKKINRDVPIVFRQEGGHATNDEDATSILEYVIEESRRFVRC